MTKKESRLRRAKRSRMKMRAHEATRLCVHRTPKHIYAQVISGDGGTVLVSASTLDPEVKKQLKSSGNTDAAKIVGALVATRAVKAGLLDVAFDSSGYKYHGRIKALADAARENGLKF
ncbi:MAG: 50S ribosomal protein L18 [Gammaproteobacteria bacterium]|nr:50S ribosomal protein L18 [Gammaproteobacteria bacterium]